jgi:uncharacterized membrane protein YkvI
VNKIIRYYLVPGFVFQSALVAGGYGTGREVMEYISQYGAVGGLIACFTAIAIFAVILGLSYEFGRIHLAYDYYAFMKHLLGRGWIAYEVLLLSSMILINAVILAASGQVASDLLPVPAWVGMIAMLLVIATLNYFGREAVVTAMGVTALCVTTILVLFALFAVSNQPEPLSSYFSSAETNLLPAAGGGATFALYSCLSIPLLMFAVVGQENRRQTLCAGLFAAVFAVVPALLLHLAFVANIGDLLDNELPTYWMLGMFDIEWFTSVYLLILFVTVVQTGVGVMHGLVERINDGLARANRPILSPFGSALTTVIVMLLSLGVAQVGIVDLVARGYSAIAAGMFFVYIVPLLTIGVYKVFFAQTGKLRAAES